MLRSQREMDLTSDQSEVGAWKRKGSYTDPQQAVCVSKRNAECCPLGVSSASCKPPRPRRKAPSMLWNELLIDICPSIVFMVFSGWHPPRNW